MTDFNKFKLKMRINQRRKKNLMSNEISNQDDNKILIYTSNDGQVKIEVRLKDENVWLTQIVSPLVTQIISQYFHRYLTKEECLFE